MNARALFATSIAAVLLVVYVLLVAAAAHSVNCEAGSDCKVPFTDEMASTLPLIAGLIAALVVAELAIAEPGEPLVARALPDGASSRSQRALQAVTSLYLAVWFVCGLVALYFALRHSDEVKALSDLGRSWLGIAIAAGYSYFGIRRP